ncbi:MAG: hypothetical protein QXU20_03600 [Candidatus Woesearchaeota archaeon]
MILMIHLRDNLFLSKRVDYKIDDELKKFKASFLDYKPDFKILEEKARRFKNLKNIIVIGFGGSINNFKAIFYALNSNKNVFFVDTVEPEYLLKIKNECKPNESLIIAVSKSGDTLGVITNLLFFINSDYKNVICITQGGLLGEIALRMGFEILQHPDIGGRFSGLTESSLFPALVCGFNIRRIFEGAKSVYDDESLKKEILELAKNFYYLERKGYYEVFMSCYSQRFFGFSFLITQLVHETFSKNGLGQTIFCCLGPESQHESNQRFFGGRRNMIGFFVRIKNHISKRIRVPKKISKLSFKNKDLEVIDNFDLKDSLDFELEGVLEHAEKEKIPFVVLELDSFEEFGVGEFMAFWQLFAYYSALLRRQNPFDQPEVEFSKEQTLNKVLGRK